jgi:hypothetical protein
MPTTLQVQAQLLARKERIRYEREQAAVKIQVRLLFPSLARLPCECPRLTAHQAAIKAKDLRSQYGGLKGKVWVHLFRRAVTPLPPPLFCSDCKLTGSDSLLPFNALPCSAPIAT